MYPAKFDYTRAGSIQEAIQLLQQHGDDAKLLAGGHSLLPMMKLRLARPAMLIDIGRIPDLKNIRTDGDVLVIGALATHTQVAASDDVRRLAPALADAAAKVGDQQVRNRGTVGGNLAHGDPASDLPPVMTALNAELTLVGPNGSRTLKAEDFFIDLFTTALEPDEILTEIRVPAAPHSAYAKLENPASGYAMVGAAVNLTMDGNTISDARVVIGGAVPKPTRASAAESALRSNALNDDTINNASTLAADGIGDWMGDIHASEDYRKEMAKVYTGRALRDIKVAS